MGYSFNTRPQSKSSFVEECVSYLSKFYEVSTHAVRGNNLWMIVNRNGEEPFILLYLLASDKGCWGYKSITEEEHPFYYSCPLNFLSKVAVKNQLWRDKVREFHSQKNSNRSNQRLSVGDNVALPGYSGTFRVVENLGRKGFAVIHNGRTFRLTCRLASSAQVQVG